MESAPETEFPKNKKKILYVVAKDTFGTPTKAADATKDKSYVCLVCEGPMILRKSGNTGKNAKRPHFAHKALTANCTPETALHFFFKSLTAGLLDEKLASGEEFEIRWRCLKCNERHSGNLLKKVKKVKVEQSLGAYKPDISLIDESGRVFAVIEIVVTHSPEESLLEYYKSNEIILIRIDLECDEDIDHIEELLSSPKTVTFCNNPMCPKCNGITRLKTMIIIDGPCHACNQTMKLATLQIGNGQFIKPDRFSIEEIAFAREKGVILQRNYSNKRQENYLSDTCPFCGSFVGKHYLFTDYYAPAEYGELASTRYKMGYECQKCSKRPEDYI